MTRKEAFFGVNPDFTPSNPEFFEDEEFVKAYFRNTLKGDDPRSFYVAKQEAICVLGIEKVNRLVEEVRNESTKPV